MFLFNINQLQSKIIFNIIRFGVYTMLSTESILPSWWLRK